MATTDTQTDALSLAELTVVDADSHVSAGIETLLPYVENEGVRRILEGAGSQADAYRKIHSATRATPGFAQTERSATGRGDALVRASSEDPGTKFEVMERFDLEYSILTPSPPATQLASVNHDQTAVEIGRAYNRWMADTFYDAGGGLVATLPVAHQRPDLAAEEIDDYADEDAVVAVQLPGQGLVPPAGHHWHDPIYGAAEDHDLPIVIHTGNAATTAAFPVQRHWAETFVEDHFFTFPVEAMWHLNSMLFNGFPEKYDIPVVFQEPGVEWLPWFTWRADDHYLQNSQDVPILRKMPSEYITDSVHITTQPLGHTDDQAHLAKMLEIAGGADTVVFSSDHPHPDFDLPEELFTPIARHLDAEDVRGIMGESAVDVFGLS